MTLGERTRRAVSAPTVGLVAALALLAPLVLAIDLPLQRAAKGIDTPGVVDDYFSATEAFGNGFGVAMIVLAVAALDRTRRVQIGRLLTASLGAGLIADTIKLTIERARPHAAGVDELLASGATAADTFAGFFPLAAAGNVGQSFPSAHTATAFGLAMVLASFYPNGRRLFVAFALGVAMQRVCVGAHFLSDVIVGAAIGLGWGVTCCGASRVGQMFDRIEVWWHHRFGWPLPEDHAWLQDDEDVIALPARVVASPPGEVRRAA